MRRPKLPNSKNRNDRRLTRSLNASKWIHIRSDVTSIHPESIGRSPMRELGYFPTVLLSLSFVTYHDTFSRMARILLGDDNPAVRRAIHQTLDGITDWHICSDADNGFQARQHKNCVQTWH